MDKLLGKFTNEYIDKLDLDDLIDLEKLLNFDDDYLYNYYNGTNTDVKFEDNKVNILFKNFKFTE